MKEDILNWYQHWDTNMCEKNENCIHFQTTIAWSMPCVMSITVPVDERCKTIQKTCKPIQNTFRMGTII